MFEYLLCLFAVVCSQVYGELFFAKGSAYKDISKDMIPTYGSFEEELSKEDYGTMWNNALHIPNLTNDRERAMWVYIEQWNGGYNRAMREWYNSSDNHFTYYWFNRLLMDSIIDVSDQHIVCYRGEPPYKLNESDQLSYTKRGHYQQGDRLFADQFEFFTLNRSHAEEYSQYPRRINGQVDIVYGTMYIVRAEYVLNSTRIDPKYQDEKEYIVPAGHSFVVTKVNHTDSLDERDEYVLDDQNV